MTLPTYEQAMETSLDRRAFSNGTEGYAWLDNWCGRCVHDKPAREGRDEDGCPLILVSLLGRTPIEWLSQEKDGVVPLGDSYHCVLFRDEDEGGDPEPKPVPDPPGQLALTPREPFEATRMLTDYPTRTAVTA